MTAPPRPLDDLTRDLRARTVISKTSESGLFFLDDEAATNASFSVEHRRDPLTLEAADAIDRLRADQQRWWSVGRGYAALTGAVPGDDVFKHFTRVSGDVSINDAIKSAANLYLANVGEHRAGEALAGLRRLAADAGYEMLAPGEVEDLRRSQTAVHAFALSTGAHAGADEVEYLAKAGARIVASERLAEDRGQEIAHLSLRLEPKSFFDEDLARLSGDVIDSIDRLRREVEAIRAAGEPPGLLGPKPSESPHEFFHRAWGWAKDHPELAPYNKDKWGYVQLWLDRLREDDLRNAPKVAETPRGAKHIYWDVAAKTITTPDAVYRGVEGGAKGDHTGDGMWAFEFAQPRIVKPEPPTPTGPTTWTVTTAFEQLEKCGYACEGGPLENNVAYRWLKRDLATKTVKSALDTLRPILMHHRLTDAFISPSGRRCSCRLDVADPSAWVDHVLELIAFGAEPPADAHVGLVDPGNHGSDWPSRPKNAHALDAGSMRCDKCGATGTLGDYCRCDPEESLPRDPSGTMIIGLEKSAWPVLRNGWPVLAIERVSDKFKGVAKGLKGVFNYIVTPLGKCPNNRAYDVINFEPPATITFYDLDYAQSQARKVDDTRDERLRAFTDRADDLSRYPEAMPLHADQIGKEGFVAPRMRNGWPILAIDHVSETKWKITTKNPSGDKVTYHVGALGFVLPGEEKTHNGTPMRLAIDNGFDVVYLTPPKTAAPISPEPPSLADLRARADAVVGSHVRFGHATEASNAIYEALKWAAGWR